MQWKVYELAPKIQLVEVIRLSGDAIVFYSLYGKLSVLLTDIMTVKGAAISPKAPRDA